MPETIQEVAERLSRAADRYRNGGDMASAARCEQGAQQAAAAADIDAAQAIENNLMVGPADAGSSGSWLGRLRHKLGFDRPNDNS